MHLHSSVRSFLLVGTLACLLAACGRPQGEPTVLRFWAMGREGEVVQELIPAFERTHPGIHVEVQQLPWQAAQEKLQAAFAGGVTPDLCQLGNTWIPQFAALKAIEPLDVRLAHDGDGIEPNDFFPGIWESNRVDDRLYGIPWYVDTRLLFYRKDLLAAAGFAAPPETWADWDAMLAAMRARSRPGAERYGVFMALDEFEPLLTLSFQQNEPLLRDGGRYGNFRSAEFRRTLQYYVDIFRHQWAPPYTKTQMSNRWEEFGRGNFAFYISGPWEVGEFKRRLPSEMQDKWMTAPVPGPHGLAPSNAGGSSLVIFQASPHKDQAWQLIKYLAQPEVERKFYALTGNLPPRRGAWDVLDRDPFAQAFRSQLERTKSPPKVPEWERIANEMQLVAAMAVKGGLTVDQAVEEMDARTDRILEKRRWMLQRKGQQ